MTDAPLGKEERLGVGDREGIWGVEPRWWREVARVGTDPVDVGVAWVVGGDVRADPRNRVRRIDDRDPGEGDVRGTDPSEDVDDVTPGGDEVGGREVGVRARTLAIPPTAVELAAEEADQHRFGEALEVARILADVA